MAKLTDILNAHDVFLLDMDGTLWKNGNLLPKVSEFLKALREHNKQIFFLSNSSRRSPTTYVDSSRKIGVVIFENEIITPNIVVSELIKCSNSRLSGTVDSNVSSFSTSVLQSLNFPLIKRVLVLGEKALVTALQSVGLQTVGSPGPDEDDKKATEMSYRGDPNIDAVIVGYDETFSYQRCTRAMKLLLNTSIPFLATNSDANVQGESALPEAGWVVAAVESACERKSTVIGKPSEIAGDYVLNLISKKLSSSSISSSSSSSSSPDDNNKLDALRGRCMMIGDRLDTDILFGIKNRMDTILVLTGVTSRHAADLSQIKATHTIASFADLFQ